MKNLVLLAAISILTMHFQPSALGQPTQAWVELINGTPNENDRALDIAVDAAGNTYSTGHVTAEVEPGLFGGQLLVAKHSPAGDRLWMATYAQSGLGSGQYIKTDPAGGGAVVAGTAGIPGFDSQWVVIKYAADGTQQWVRNYMRQDPGIVGPTDLKVDSSGNVWVIGLDTINGTRVAVILKYSAAGATLISMTYSALLNDVDANAIEVDNATGEFYLAGSLGNFAAGQGEKMCVIKFSAAGAHLWTRTAGINGPFVTNVAKAIARDAAGNIIAGGDWSINSGLGNDVGLMKVTPTGTVLWSLGISARPTSFESLYGLGIDASTGDIVVAGATSLVDQTDAMVCRVSAAGVLQWTQITGVPTWLDVFWDIAADDDGNCYAAGRLAATNGTYGAAVVKYAPDGTQLWQDIYRNIPLGSDEWVRVLLSTAEGPSPSVHTAGNAFAPATRQDYVVRKMYQTIPLSPPCIGDANGDSTVSFGDITSVLSQWGADYAPGSGPGDADANGHVDFADITSVLALFGALCP